MKIGIDLDGVLRNLCRSMCKRWHIKTGIKKRPADILGWDAHEYLEIEKVGMTAEDFYQWWFNNENIYRLALPILGSRNGVAQLAKEFDLMLVSDQSTATARLWSIKFVNYCFPEIGAIYFGSDKSLVYLDAMIDDRIYNLKSNVASHRILFDQPWNQEASSDIYRAKGWQDVLDYFFGRKWDDTSMDTGRSMA